MSKGIESLSPTPIDNFLCTLYQLSYLIVSVLGVQFNEEQMNQK